MPMRGSPDFRGRFVEALAKDLAIAHTKAHGIPADDVSTAGGRWKARQIVTFATHIWNELQKLEKEGETK